MVVTTALKAELPQDWLKERGIPVLSRDLWERRAGKGGEGLSSGIAVWVTGTGQAASFQKKRAGHFEN